MGVESSESLSRRSTPSRRWRRTPRHRIGPLRSISEAAPHPILRGMRSGALAGLALVAGLGLPILLVFTVKAPPPVMDEAPAAARVWAAEPVARVAAEPPTAAPAAPSAPARGPVATAGAGVEPGPARAAPGPAPAAPPATPARGDGARSALSLDLIPVLDDASGGLTIEDSTAAAVAKPARPARAAAAKPPRTP
jgi:hypothetical protein